MNDKIKQYISRELCVDYADVSLDWHNLEYNVLHQKKDNKIVD